MRTGVIAAVTATLLSTSAMAAERSIVNPAPGKGGTFYCIAEWSGGGRYNEGTKIWEGFRFKPDSKFVLKITEAGNHDEDGLRYNDFTVTVTAAGSSYPHRCTQYLSNRVTQWGNGFRCSAVALDYVFDFVSNRFLEIYSVGFFNSDDNADNPAISGGTCTKIGD